VYGVVATSPDVVIRIGPMASLRRVVEITAKILLHEEWACLQRRPKWFRPLSGWGERRSTRGVFLGQ